MSKSNADHQESDRLATLRSQLEAAGCGDACFRLSALPCPAFVGQTSDVAMGIGWCPQGLPTGQSVHLASSRLSRQLETFPAWFDALRTFAINVNPDDAFLMTAEGTTSDPWAARIGDLFDIPVVRVKRFPKRVTAQWIEQQELLPSQQLRTMWVEAASDVSLDDVLIAIASEVRVLRVRNKGNVHRAVLRRLEAKAGRTWLLIDPSLTKSSESKKLIQAGATGWWLYPSAKQSSDPTRLPAHVGTEGSAQGAAVIAVADVDSTEYAIHWTRRRDGAWPDQSNPEYLDDLIFRRDSSDHHALSSLRRILMTQRILASNVLTRSPTPVVCFADVRLTEIEERRTFRSHLARWDFEPYGIAIRKEFLERQGARAVIYGDESDWEVLADVDRPFFQRATGEGKQDWRSEYEIRVCGDLPLRRIGPDDAVVFVPSLDEAQQIAPLSRWPVVVLAG